MATISIRCLNVKLKYHLIHVHGDTLRVESENKHEIAAAECIRLYSIVR